MKNKGNNIANISKNLKKDLDALSVFIENISEKHSISKSQTLELLKKQKQNDKELLFPTSIFKDKSLGILESVTKYLKEELNLSYHNMGILLNRDDRVIWVTCNKAIKKRQERFTISGPNEWIPVSVFADKKFAPLESVAIYLVDVLNMGFVNAAKLLNRDNRSIWSAYNKKKGGKNEG